MPPKRKNKRKSTESEASKRKNKRNRTEEEPEDKKESKFVVPFVSHGKLIADKCPSGTDMRYCHGRYFYTDPQAPFYNGLSDAKTCSWCETYGPRSEFQANAEPWQKFKEIERLTKRMKPETQNLILWLAQEFAQDAHAQRCIPYQEPEDIEEFRVDFQVPPPPSDND